MTRGIDTGDASTARVEELVTRFREIGNAQVADLPIYNDKLTVEAVGFRPLDRSALFGVLITPWFMNAVVLPREKKDLDDAALGRAAIVTLPAGPTKFRIGGDDVVGTFQSLSIHSPMSAFSFQEAARVEAEKTLASLLAPPEDEDTTAVRIGSRARTGFDNRPSAISPRQAQRIGQEIRLWSHSSGNTLTTKDSVAMRWKSSSL